jgi:prolyl oligopeptidase
MNARPYAGFARPRSARFARTWVLPLLGICLSGPAFAQVESAGPPTAPVRPVVDTLFGVPVTDPYRYMENLDDIAVQTWFRQENAYTRSVLDRIPGRATLLADIEKYVRSAPAAVWSVTRLPDDVYLYTKTLPDQQVARLYLRPGLSAGEQLLFDPTRYQTKGGPQWAIDYYRPSFDGRYVAIGISPGGSEHAILHVVETRTGRETKGAIDRAWFGGVYWRPDNRSFFYNRVRKLPPDAPPSATEEESHIYLHVVGTDPDQDRLVFGYGVSPGIHVEATDIPYVITTPGSAYALGLLQHGAMNDVTLYAAAVDSVDGPHAPWRKVADLNDAVAGFIDADDQATGITLSGHELYVLSHKDAPRYQVLRTSLSHPDIAHAETVVPQSGVVIKGVWAARDGVYVKELDGVVGRILRVAYAHGAPEVLPLPFDGAVTLQSVDPTIDGALFKLASWTRAPTVYAYDPAMRKVADTGLQPTGPYDAPQDLVSEELVAQSYDGTMVPLSITYRRGMKLDRSNPTLLEAYGAYGLTLSPPPPYRLALGPWFARGGVYAVAHVRGGGVYGVSWHEAGQKLTKPNTWRDLIACAEYLVARKYTSSSRLAILGGSAGGITVGRAMTERPDLFAAVIDAVGISNALRFEFTPNGPPNISEFGSIKTQAGFEDLYAMDAYQHVRDGVRYPAVLLTTGWNDPRVAPWEPGKMTARLQAVTASGKSVLLRVDYSAGHGVGSSRAQHEAEFADYLSFMLWQFGVPEFQPRNQAGR